MHGSFESRFLESSCKQQHSLNENICPHGNEDKQEQSTKNESAERRKSLGRYWLSWHRDDGVLLRCVA